MGRLKIFESTYRRKDGSLFTGSVSGTLITMDHKTWLLSTVRDISGRKQAEKALQESEEKFRAFIELALEGFMLLDEQGNLIEFNLGIEKISGLSRQAVIGKPAWEIMASFMLPGQRLPVVIEGIKMQMIQGVTTGQSPIFIHPFEGLLYKAEGDLKYIRQVAFPIKTMLG